MYSCWSQKCCFNEVGETGDDASDATSHSIDSNQADWALASDEAMNGTK